MKPVFRSPIAWIGRCFESVRFQWRNNAGQKNPLRSFLSALLLATGLHRWFAFSHHGSRLRLRAAGLSRQLWRDPETLLDGEVFFSRCLRAGDVVVDVGANIGVHTLLAARIVGERGG